MTPSDVLKFAEKHGAKFVDLQVHRLPGHLAAHHGHRSSSSTRTRSRTASGFDGSSIRGWQPINASDMLIIPDPTTAKIDPFTQYPTLSLICNVVDPITKEPYSRDPRNIASKAEKYLKSTGIADICYFGPEAEFFVFDDIRYDSQPNQSFYFIDSVEGRWNTGREECPNLGYKPRYKDGYFPVAPTDSLVNLRAEMVTTMQDGGHRRRDAAPRGRHRRSVRDRHALRAAASRWPTRSCGSSTSSRTSRAATARRRRSCRSRSTATTARACTATSRCGRARSRSSPATATPGCREMALYYIGGIIKHAKAICAFTNPTTNCYRRLMPGFEAPVNLAYSSRNRSASIRIPMFSTSPKAKRIEFRSPDPSCNPYLAFAAMMMAGLDGIEKRIHPGEPLDKDIYALSPEELKEVPSVPGSLDEALEGAARTITSSCSRATSSRPT